MRHCLCQCTWEFHWKKACSTQARWPASLAWHAALLLLTCVHATLGEDIQPLSAALVSRVLPKEAVTIGVHGLRTLVLALAVSAKAPCKQSACRQQARSAACHPHQSALQTASVLGQHCRSWKMINVLQCSSNLALAAPPERGAQGLKLQSSRKWQATQQAARAGTPCHNRAVCSDQQQWLACCRAGH